MTATTWTTIYYTGGSENGAWHRCLPVATKAEAETQAQGIRQGGRKALVGTTARWDTGGLPEGERYVAGGRN